MTSMTRRHGNNVIRSKIMVLKKLMLGAQLEYFKLTCERVKGQSLVQTGQIHTGKGDQSDRGIILES